MSEGYTFREIDASDAPHVREIFDYYAKCTMNYFSSAEVTITEVEELMNECISGFVAVYDTKVVGVAFAYSYRSEKEFAQCAKFTYFLLPEHCHKGIGSQLHALLEKDSKSKKIVVALVNISGHNNESIRFHEKLGYEKCGHFKKVGEKFGKSLDVIWMQKELQ